MAAALATGCDIVTASLGPEHTSQWQKTYTIAPNGSVEIDNVNGKIAVEPSSGSTVEVIAIKKARAASEEAAKTILDRITFDEDVSASRVKVEAKFPRSEGFTFGNSGNVEFRVKVPAGVEASFSNVNGEVSLRGMNGRVKAQTTNGGVTARDMTGQLDARTTNGGLTIDLAKVPEGGVKLRCTNGGINVQLPRDAKATISASITNGGIRTSDLPLEMSGDNNRRHIDARMNGGGPLIEATGTNGGISLTSR
jgi:DUF4097 and DUF4098 domain-containing protein YvlB